MSRVARDVIPQQFPLQKASLQPIPNLINQHSLNDLAKEETKMAMTTTTIIADPSIQIWKKFGLSMGISSRSTLSQRTPTHSRGPMYQGNNAPKLRHTIPRILVNIINAQEKSDIMSLHNGISRNNDKKRQEGS